MPNLWRFSDFGADPKLLKPVEELAWGDDGRLQKSAKFEQVFVAADQIMTPREHRTGQEFIVVGVLQIGRFHTSQPTSHSHVFACMSKPFSYNQSYGI